MLQKRLSVEQQYNLLYFSTHSPQKLLVCDDGMDTLALVELQANRRLHVIIQTSIQFVQICCHAVLKDKDIGIFFSWRVFPILCPLDQHTPAVTKHGIFNTLDGFGWKCSVWPKTSVFFWEHFVWALDATQQDLFALYIWSRLHWPRCLPFRTLLFAIIKCCTRLQPNINFCII